MKAVVFDWAGTMVDYGCFAPLAVFLQVFKKRGIELTAAEAREPMGMLKRDHIQALCKMERVAALWQERYGRLPNEADVDELYADFEPMLMETLHEYATPVPGAIELVGRLREQGIKIGSTTGYTRDMMNVVAASAKQQGYEPDALVTPSEVPAGRPFPWMCYQNAILLDVFPMNEIVKVGDTTSDMKEGRNAGMWTVGVLKGGSELGLSLEEVKNMPQEELDKRLAIATERLMAAGAHYVVAEIGCLDEVLKNIEMLHAEGERP
ncbi:phosphonoacetaldehyde hydrolase [Brevibacillus porteri]|uniref:Phosphonoacetaldehyde hydrolase n=1 Tax=Brevibacillus porteri TaxID=2126350 RepID=A0ABX5FUY7_9BACL|nr:phosphonoacetaldehyde hydrolase [Brevibacillus porteri]MED1798017.1 phosphonoacetaldehyde hydrolase [Brevibacillus porteri]MED2132148.1 phosphonoacetaldehyde hydrolase [Brevibacillus porteri]MED2742711.1 phosphonoacetaldehyde hydrolase [Brevibacillus porteri]MED2814187.1 phosphonoacetaldehyde hydrolase [Brevibacillus porteri]MED2893748.1 phosphonoacetaldehyde hydrolase [Brevibacillus porteri]